MLHLGLRLLNEFFGEPSPQRPKRRPSLRLEALEDRLTPVNGTASGTISGLTFLDLNNNGTRQTNEPTISGVTVILSGRTTDGNVPVNARVVSNAGGGFSFENVLQGSYQIRVVAPAGAYVGTPNLTVNTPLNVTNATVRRDRGVLGVAPGAVSLRQFRNIDRIAAFPQLPAGSGLTRVNTRPNDAPTVNSAIADVSVAQDAADTILDLAGNFTDGNFTNNNSRIRFKTSEGDINLDLFDGTARRTVENFFNYINSNRYDNSIFHRLVNNFVLQGGGFGLSTNPQTVTTINTDPAITNEFGQQNNRGTIAMAKTPGNPNSATSQFFFNLANNSNLNTDNGGFTVFGRVASTADQAVVDRFAGYTITNQGGSPQPLSELPLKGGAGSGTFPGQTERSRFALINDVQIIKRDEFLTYTVVSNSNATLVTPTIVNNRLTLDYATGQTGTSTVVIRATDRFGASVTDSFVVTVT